MNRVESRFEFPHKGGLYKKVSRRLAKYNFCFILYIWNNFLGEKDDMPNMAPENEEGKCRKLRPESVTYLHSQMLLQMH